MKTVLIDGDSIAYMGGAQSSYKECTTLIDKLIGGILEACESNIFELYIECPFDKDIFRKHVAVTKPYKGNRKAERPAFLVEAKQHMIKRWNATVAKKVEAEDLVAIRATELGSKAIIAGIDKDLLQVPGRHFNYRALQFIDVSQFHGDFNLHLQWLMGDCTDNITGIPGLGIVRASKLIEECETTEELVGKVNAAYKDANLDDDYKLEQYRLVYLLRDREEAKSMGETF